MKVSSRIAQWLILVLALLILGGVLSWGFYSEYHRIDSQERKRLTHQARVIDENLSLQLLATNLALDSIRRDLHYLRQQKNGEIFVNQRLQAMSESMPGVRTLFVIDADGTVTASNRKELIGRDLSNGEAFQLVRQTRNPVTLHVSRPYTTPLGIYAINVAKGIVDARGEFNGMVGAVLDPEYFSALLDSVRYEPDMWSAIRHGDGQQFLMIPPRPGMQGIDLNKPGSFFSRHRDSGQKATVMTGIPLATGDDSMMAQRTVKPDNVPMDKPLVVAVSRALTGIFAPWRRDVVTAGALFAIIALIALIAAAGLFVLQWRQRAEERVAVEREAERKHAEAALRRSELLFETVANRLPAMLGYWTSDLHCTFSNSAYFDWFGRTAEQMKGISMQDLLGEDLFKLNEPYFRAVLGGEDQQFERQIVKPNGEIRVVLARYIADHSEAVVKGFFVLATDITDMKIGEEALRVAAVAFESQEGIVVIGADHKILKSNRAVALLTGLAEQALVGKTVAEFRSPRHTPAFYAHIWSEVASTGGWQGDFWTQHFNGGELMVHATVSAVRDELGRITHYVCNFSDVTDVRQAEQNRLNDEAAQRNALVREVHHRIKNNLQGVTGLLRQLSQKNPTLADDVNKAVSQVQSIALVHGLQGRDRSGAIHLGDLIAVIARDVGGMWQTTVSVSNVPELHQSTVAEYEGVPIALVLTELVSNAILHGGKAAGGVSITLHGTPQQNTVQVKISNPGLLAADRDHNGKFFGGLQLVAALVPKVGATLTLQQEGEHVVALLVLAPPIIEASPKETL